MLASLDQLAHRVDAIVQKLACACSVLCTSTVSGKTWLADLNEAAQGRALAPLYRDHLHSIEGALA